MYSYIIFSVIRSLIIPKTPQKFKQTALKLTKFTHSSLQKKFLVILFLTCFQVKISNSKQDTFTYNTI